MIKFILISFLLHFIDDFYLQVRFLNKGKQKTFWETLVPKDEKLPEKYRYDYIICLLIHGLEWSILTFLPIILFGNLSNVSLLLVVLVNAFIHSFVDDLKCNRSKINLITDQFIHASQILLTYFIIIGD